MIIPFSYEGSNVPSWCDVENEVSGSGELWGYPDENSLTVGGGPLERTGLLIHITAAMTITRRGNHNTWKAVEGEKRTIAVQYQPSDTILRYFRNMRDQLKG